MCETHICVWSPLLGGEPQIQGAGSQIWLNLATDYITHDKARNMC